MTKSLVWGFERVWSASPRFGEAPAHRPVVRLIVVEIFDGGRGRRRAYWSQPAKGDVPRRETDTLCTFVSVLETGFFFLCLYELAVAVLCSNSRAWFLTRIAWFSFIFSKMWRDWQPVYVCVCFADWKKFSVSHKQLAWTTHCNCS